MNWQRAIEVNRAALFSVVASLCALIRLVAPEGVTAATKQKALAQVAGNVVTRATRNHVLRLLRPAESALRRLIYAQMRLAQAGGGLAVPDDAAQPLKKSPRASRHAPKRDWSDYIRPFLLYDAQKDFGQTPRRKIAKNPPRILFPLTEGFVFTPTPPYEPPLLDDRLPVAPITKRVIALQIALGDFAAQAKRMARAEAHRLGRNKHRCKAPPMRVGWPPGYNKRRPHEVHDILHQSDWLGREAYANADFAPVGRAPP